MSTLTGFAATGGGAPFSEAGLGGLLLFKSELLEDIMSMPESASELMRAGGELMLSLFSGCSEVRIALVELERGGGGGGAIFGLLELLVLVPLPLPLLPFLIRSCSFTSVDEGLDFLLLGDTAFAIGGLTVTDESTSAAAIGGGSKNEYQRLEREGK